jgi:hypothetical protein
LGGRPTEARNAIHHSNMELHSLSCGRPARFGRAIREVDAVVGNSPADRVGLENGDYILDASGYVVGPYQGVYYPLSDALNYGADPDGWVEQLIWNRRTSAEETAWVQLQRR